LHFGEKLSVVIELSFYISPEDHTRLQVLLDKLGMAEREFLYRALMRYIAIKEKEVQGLDLKHPTQSESQF
jgi:hypothetical protein